MFGCRVVWGFVGGNDPFVFIYGGKEDRGSWFCEEQGSACAPYYHSRGHRLMWIVRHMKNPLPLIHSLSLFFFINAL